MSDPKRLLESGGDERHRALLASASDDGPSQASRRAAMAALGIAPVLAGVGATQSSLWHKLLHWKWMGVAAVAATLTVGGLVHKLTTPVVIDAPPVRVTQPIVPNEPREVEADPQAPDEEPAPPPPRHRSRTRTSQVADEPPARAQARTLEEELALIDTAREARREHRTRDALRVIERYEREFPEGALRPEAAFLHIQMLLELGDQADAASAAHRFVASYPESPLVQKVRALIEKSTSD